VRTVAFSSKTAQDSLARRFPPPADWIEQVTRHFPRLSKPQAAGLALWSLGLILARSCSLESRLVVNIQADRHVQTTHGGMLDRRTGLI